MHRLLLLILLLPSAAQAAGPVVLETGQSPSKVSVEDVFRGASGEVEVAPGAGRAGTAAMLAAGGGLLLLTVLAVWRYKPDVASRPHHAHRLARDLSRAAGLSRAEVRQLKRLAAQNQWENPMLPLICPSLLKPDHPEKG